MSVAGSGTPLGGGQWGGTTITGGGTVGGTTTGGTTGGTTITGGGTVGGTTATGGDPGNTGGKNACACGVKATNGDAVSTTTAAGTSFFASFLSLLRRVISPPLARVRFACLVRLFSTDGPSPLEHFPGTACASGTAGCARRARRTGRRGARAENFARRVGCAFGAGPRRDESETT